MADTKNNQSPAVELPDGQRFTLKTIETINEQGEAETAPINPPRKIRTAHSTALSVIKSVYDLISTKTECTPSFQDFLNTCLSIKKEGGSGDAEIAHPIKIPLDACNIALAYAMDALHSDGSESWAFATEAAYWHGLCRGLNDIAPNQRAHSSEKARRAAFALHEGDHKDRKYVEEFYRKNHALFKSKNAIAKELSPKHVRQEYLTVRNWLKKLQP